MIALESIAEEAAIRLDKLEDCTGCGSTAEEVCNGLDDDGQIDEGFQDGAACATEGGQSGLLQNCECIPFGPRLRPIPDALFRSR